MVLITENESEIRLYVHDGEKGIPYITLFCEVHIGRWVKFSVSPFLYPPKI